MTDALAAGTLRAIPPTVVGVGTRPTEVNKDSTLRETIDTYTSTVEEPKKVLEPNSQGTPITDLPVTSEYGLGGGPLSQNIIYDSTGAFYVKFYDSP